MGRRHTLTGRLHVALPPDQAFRLFTARGEQEWVAGWHPHFPVPTDDDTAPGTVFVTDRTTWVVLDRTPGRHIRYARIVPTISAGTVSITVTPSAATPDPADSAGAGSAGAGLGGAGSAGAGSASAGSAGAGLGGAGSGDAGGSDVTVTYDLTALTDATGRDLDAFAAGYPDFLRSWQDAIATALTP